jgi:hypothetical protein
MNKQVTFRLLCEMKGLFRLMLLCLTLVSLGGCAGALVEQTGDVVIAVAKAPFKVGQALVDLVVGTDKDKDKDK